LAAAAISTGALADLIRSVPRPMKPSWIVHIVVVAFLLATVSFLFGDVYATSVNPQAVQKYSVILLIAVAFTSFAAVLRAETS
jgi:high-affinity K+ transport system ATPase subunit B